ncbi:Molybdopterin-synthase adenylyltransferase [Anaerohalosphaera lusitana]|uniref:Molybdopterin-synthase adenylyltransferase n=1 Tax=Anaerohalosphaera lusitana TaxID=1936003 RepID=A0A1U9NMZ6_9BACT|nr:sulfur carrier protein ThiS adenylyltransferase ThiF [Anaerohalosphaera lusitana]AQT69283.1 Molybdopterin-synthase adenylyltransferase [Anaerohalosphaera lusitana]
MGYRWRVRPETVRLVEYVLFVDGWVISVHIYVNEKQFEVVDRISVQQVREQFKLDADVVIVNGFAVSGDVELREGDRVVLIKRGELPGRRELEGLMVARHTPGVHERVKAATVGIAGLGGLGSAIAIALARVGVGRLVVADFDVVEPSNLNRQQYFVDQIGMTKTEATRENIERINPYVKVISHQGRIEAGNVAEVFGGVDVMCEAFDGADQKAMLCESFTGAFSDTPLVMAAGVAGFERSNTVVTRKLGKNLYLVGDMETGAGLGVGLMSPRVGIAAHHQANAVLRLLLGEEVG